MQKFALLAFSALFASSAFAASYDETFLIQTPAVTCKVETSGRAIGREVNVIGSPELLLKAATSKSASMAHTRVKDLSGFDYGQSCEGLADLPKTLKGQRELRIQRLESQGECNVLVIEEVHLKLGHSGVSLLGRAAWPIIGKGISAYTKENCKLKESDFKQALREALGK